MPRGNSTIHAVYKLLLIYREGKMNIFKCDKTINSYTAPVIKICVAVAIIIFILNRSYFFTIDEPWLNLLVGFISFAITYAALYCIYISVAEIMCLRERREEANASTSMKHSKAYAIDSVLRLITANDIIEIAIIIDSKIVRIGAASDCLVGSSDFFDKSYYIGEDEYTDFEVFSQALRDLLKEDTIFVVTVDGVHPSKWRDLA